MIYNKKLFQYTRFNILKFDSKIKIQIDSLLCFY